MSRWRLIPHDRLLHFASIALAFLGLLAVFTTTFFPQKAPSGDFWQQVLFFVGGVILYTLISNLPTNLWRSPRLLAGIYVLTVFSLLVILVLPSSGPKRWLNFGVFSLQVSEFAKLTLILVSSMVLSKTSALQLSLRKRNITIPRWLIAAALTSPFIILVWRQPSLGSAMLMVLIFALIALATMQQPLIIFIALAVFLAGLNVDLNLTAGTFQTESWGRIAIMVLITLASILLSRSTLRNQTFILVVIAAVGIGSGFAADYAWNTFVSDYQKERITAFVNPDTDPLGSQWQVNQAKIAIGSAGLLGKGILNGSQTNSGLLTYAYTDFAYAGFVEQFGLVGGGILVGLILLISQRALVIASQCEQQGYRLIAVGVMGLFFINTILHIAMNLGLMPVTGVPLPLVSYGGSAVLANFIGLGILQSIAALESKRYGTQHLGIQPQFRYNHSS